MNDDIDLWAGWKIKVRADDETRAQTVATGKNLFEKFAEALLVIATTLAIVRQRTREHLRLKLKDVFIALK